MISKSGKPVTTAAELFELPNDGNRYELINGVLNMMSPAGSEHGRIAGRIYLRLAAYVEEQKLGETYAAETGFRISTTPDTVRAPDAAFISHQRLAELAPTSGYLPIAPDLVVEVVSPNDSFSNVEAKAFEWLSAGTKLVLVADPANITLCAYQDQSEIRIHHENDSFSAGEACPGWVLKVNDAFQIQS